MRLLETTTHEMARRAPRLAFWPIGTIEAHDLGPLGTDVIAPNQLATDLAPRFDALLLPALPYGLVSSLAGYPGGMWMSDETFRRVVHELCCSLSRSSVRETIIFNGHGGNTKALGDVLPGVWKTCQLKVAFIDWWTAGQDLAEKHFGSAGGHGGADELALVRASDPALVPDEWDGSRAFAVRPGVRVYPSPRSAMRYGEGEARPLTAASAQAFHAELVDRLAQVVQEILAGWQSFDELTGS